MKTRISETVSQNTLDRNACIITGLTSGTGCATHVKPAKQGRGEL
jgi:hypothetical protein